MTRLTAFLRNVNWGFVAALAFCYGVWYFAVMQLLAYLGGVK